MTSARVIVSAFSSSIFQFLWSLVAWTCATYIYMLVSGALRITIDRWTATLRFRMNLVDSCDCSLEWFSSGQSTLIRPCLF
jgi:hypothetical protein